MVMEAELGSGYETTFCRSFEGKVSELRGKVEKRRGNCTRLRKGKEKKGKERKGYALDARQHAFTSKWK